MFASCFFFGSRRWRTAQWSLRWARPACDRQSYRGLPRGLYRASRRVRLGSPPTAHRTTEPWRMPGAASRERWRDSPRRLSVKITTARLAKTTCKPVLKRAGEGPEDPLAAQHRRYSFGSFPAARRRRASSFRLAPPKQPKSEGATRPEASKSGQEVAPQVSGPRSTPSPIRGRYTKKSTLRADARSARDTRKATLRDARSAKDAERRLPTTV